MSSRTATAPPLDNLSERIKKKLVIQKPLNIQNAAFKLKYAFLGEVEREEKRSDFL